MFQQFRQLLLHPGADKHVPILNLHQACDRFGRCAASRVTCKTIPGKDHMGALTDHLLAALQFFSMQ